MLFEPFDIKNVAFKNRILRSSIGGRTAYYDGSVSPAWKSFEARFARSGVAGIVSATMGVNSRRLSPLEYPSISEDRFIKPLREGVREVQALGCRYIMQIGDPGGHTQMGLFSEDADAKSASEGFDLSFGYRNTTSPMSLEEIQASIQEFADAARRVREIGCDGLEITASKGYLIHQFLNPATNRRTDAYGGSVDNRFRFLSDVVAAVRREIGADFLFGVRLAANDFNCLPVNIRWPVVFPFKQYWHGNGLPESTHYAQRLEQLGVDYLHIDNGFGFPHPHVNLGAFPLEAFRLYVNSTRHLSAKAAVRATILNVLPKFVVRAIFGIGWNVPPGSNAGDASQIKQVVKIPVIANGGFQARDLIESTLKDGKCDMISMARPLLANPDLLEVFQSGRNLPEKPCTFCGQCCVRTAVHPLGCYDRSRFPSDIAMEQEILRWSASPSSNGQATETSRSFAMALPAPFDSLSPLHAKALEAAFQDVAFSEGQRLFKEGDDGDCLYVIVQGQVRLQQEREELDSDSVLGFIEPGAVVGEISVLDRGPRSASAYAQTDVAAKRLSRSRMENLAAANPAAYSELIATLARIVSKKLRMTTDRLAVEIFKGVDSEIDDMVERADAAWRKFATASDAEADAVLKAIAAAATEHAEFFAQDTVATTRIGNVADKTMKNKLASVLAYDYIAAQPTTGVIAKHPERRVTDLAAPVGVVFGLIPMTNPAATAIFKTLACLKGRNALIMNFHRSTLDLADKVCGLFRDILADHGMPVDLIQHVRRRGSRRTTELLMTHKKVSFILATGGASMVKAAYSSGKPAIGVGPGNSPTLICADADIDHAASAIVMSKTFDNGLICGSEHNLVVVASVRDAFVAALEAQGAAVLTDEEAKKLTKTVVQSPQNNFRSEVVGQAAAIIAKAAGIERPYTIKLLVVPTEGVVVANPWTHEKMAPMLSLFVAQDEKEGISMCRGILEIEGIGHTAMIFTRDDQLAKQYGLAMPVSRILVNSPGIHGIVGATTGLVPSFTLGCGTFAGNSTTDNVSCNHLINVKRLAEYIPNH